MEKGGASLDEGSDSGSGWREDMDRRDAGPARSLANWRILGPFSELGDGEGGEEHEGGNTRRPVLDMLKVRRVRARGWGEIYDVSRIARFRDRRCNSVTPDWGRGGRHQC